MGDLNFALFLLGGGGGGNFNSVLNIYLIYLKFYCNNMTCVVFLIAC